MRLLTILAYLFACVGALAAALVGISFSDTYREQFLGVKLLLEDRIQLLLVSVVFWVMAYAAKLWGEFLGMKPHLQSVPVSGGQLSQKATWQGVENELSETDDTLAREAWPHLDAAEREFAAKRYREAAASFQKSLEVLPTMSGYLNLGVSQMYLWEFHQAEGNFMSGAHLAQRQGNKEFEGAFLLNLGNTYFREGKYERALESYRSALKFYEQLGDSAAQAAIFHNSGIVYHAQGKFEEAFKY